MLRSPGEASHAALHHTTPSPPQLLICMQGTEHPGPTGQYEVESAPQQVHRTAFGVRLSKPASQAHEVHFIDRTAHGVRWKQQSEGNETTLRDDPRSSLRRIRLHVSAKCPRVHHGSATRLPPHLHPNSPYNPQQTAHHKRGAQRHTKQHSHYSHTTSSGDTSSFPQITQMLTSFIRDHSSCHSINVDPRNMREKTHSKED